MFRHVYHATIGSKRCVVQLKLRWTPLIAWRNQCNRRYPCNHCTRRRRPEECVYTSPPVTQFPSTLSLVNEGHNQASDHPQDSGEQPGIEDTNAFSVGLQYKDDGSSYDHRSTLLESFGYSEDSNSNTMALLKMVRARMTFHTNYLFRKLIPVRSGIRNLCAIR